MPARTRTLGSVVVVALAICAFAAGTIDKTGATFNIGNAPTLGAIVEDPDAPAASAPAIPPLGSLGTLGTFSSPLPAFGGGGTGADGAFAVTVTQNLPGGTYNYTTYTVDPGVTVTYDGPVTILTTGDANVLGTVRTILADQSITIRCGGIFTLGSGARVRAEMTGGDVTLDVANSFSAASTARLDAVGGDVTLVTNGLGAGLGNVVLDNADLNTSTGDVVVKAAGALTVTGDSDLNTSTGDLLLQAFGGDATFGGSTNLNLSSAATTGITVEASGAVTFDGSGTNVNTSTGDIVVRAFGGDVTFSNGVNGNTSTGDIDLAASGSVRFTQDSSVNTSSGNHVFTAFGGDVELLPTGGSTFVNSSTGDILFAASRHVIVNGDGGLNVSTGNYLFRALGGDVRFLGEVDTNASSGTFEARASNAITIMGLDSDHDSISLFAGAGGITANPGDEASLDASDQGLTIVALGAVSLDGDFRAMGDIHVVSCNAGVDVGDADLRTDEVFGEGTSSSDVRLESFAGDAGSILAVDAAFQTGGAGERSGDIVLLVHDSKAGAAPAIDSFLLPKNVAVRIDAGDAAKSRLNTKGFFDTGSGPSPGLAGTATLHVGDQMVNAQLAANAAGVFLAKTETYNLTVKPARTGSSKAKFKLWFVGNFSGFLDAVGSGPLTVRFVNASVDGTGTVTLTNGRYRLGKKRGELLAPTLFPFFARAKLGATDGTDSLQLRAGLASLGDPPAAAAEVEVSFGDTYSATIPAAAFTGSNGVFTAVKPIPGVAKVVVDYLKERVIFVAKKVELGAFPDDPGVPATIALRIGADERAVRVRLGRKGPKLGY